MAATRWSMGRPAGTMSGWSDDDEREPLRRGDPGEERHQRARRGIGAMQVLEDEDDRAAVRRAARASRGRPRGARAWRRSGAPSCRRRRRPAGPSSRAAELRQEPDEVGGGGPEDGGELVVGERARAPARWPGRPARTARRCRPASRRPQDGHRLAQPADAPDGLVEEPGDPDAGRTAEEQGPGAAAGRIVEHGREPRECVLAPDEPRARVPAGHIGILGVGPTGGWSHGEPLSHGPARRRLG